jgi:hypothetical protein
MADAIRALAPNLVYCYLSDLDTIGHMRGWRSGVARTAGHDRPRRGNAGRPAPPDAQLVVTADHGMVDVAGHDKIDYDSEPELSAGVEMIAGEPRARYLYVAPDDLDAVRARWQRRVGDRMDVVTARRPWDKAGSVPQSPPKPRAASAI